MNYYVEEAKVSEFGLRYRVLDEHGVQNGEDFLHPLHAQWHCEDLNTGKKPLNEQESLNLTNDILGEIEQAHETGTTPAVEEQTTPVRENCTEVRISGKHEVGTLIEYRGESWLVTHCEYENGIEPANIRDEMDEVPSAGWYSWLFRVGVNTKAMQIVSEQYQDGAVQFTSPTTVKFADEEYASDLRDLAYSPEIGLYDKQRMGVSQ